MIKNRENSHVLGKKGFFYKFSFFYSNSSFWRLFPKLNIFGVVYSDILISNPTDFNKQLNINNCCQSCVFSHSCALVEAKVSTYGNMLEFYPWLTFEFVQKLIEESELNGNVVLKSFNATKCFNDGENFSSVMVGLEVVFEDVIEGNEKERNFLNEICSPKEGLQ